MSAMAMLGRVALMQLHAYIGSPVKDSLRLRWLGLRCECNYSLSHWLNRLPVLQLCRSSPQHF